MTCPRRSTTLAEQSKSEARNPKPETNPNPKGPKSETSPEPGYGTRVVVWVIPPCSVLWVCFEFRASNFEFAPTSYSRRPPHKKKREQLDRQAASERRREVKGDYGSRT